jgi:uncharacterized Rossmann fold enzyme|tara:strand:+ start:446 stop:1108 length:663 start_codon:yes stop_codon:yes gene_type:complete
MEEPRQLLLDFSPQIEFQDQIRDYFGWEIFHDRESARRLSQAANPNFSIDLSSYEKIGIIGAAASKQDIADSDCDFFIVADGSVGAIDDLSKVLFVVSDADGYPYLKRAIESRIPIALHAHGDNTEAWEYLLSQLSDDYPLILTHQLPEKIEGMINPGGFTDGDRAVCLAMMFGLKKEACELIGFCTNSVGQWSGVTNKSLKLKKLLWMEKILNAHGFFI